MELMFRAWDTHFKRWIAKDFHIMGEVTCFRVIEQYMDDNPREDQKASLDRWTDIRISQFTGRTDKVGNNIYVGDILHYKGDICPHCEHKTFYEGHDPYYIIYSSERASFECYEYGSTDNNWIDPCSWGRTLEVVGSLYEEDK